MSEFNIIYKEKVGDDFRICIMRNGYEVGHAAGNKRRIIELHNLDVSEEDQGCYFELTSMFVNKDYRGANFKFGDNLIQRFEKLAIENNATYIEGAFGYHEAYETPEMRVANQTRFYTRNGHTIKGERFIKNLSNF